MDLRNLTLITSLALVLSLGACSEQASEAPVVTEPSAETLQQAAVAMPDIYGAEVGEQILKAGGNAVDAAIASGFSLAVTLPAAGNIGGGGFMLIHMDGVDSFIDYREKAPLAADRDMYLDENGDPLDDVSRIGHLSVGVPGTVAGFWEAHQRYGTVPWKSMRARPTSLITSAR